MTEPPPAEHLSHPLGRGQGPRPVQAPAAAESGWPVAPQPAWGPLPPSQSVAAAQARTWAYALKFTGNTGDYFRIWIVNTALSIVTLGLFLPWAKVRQRRYLYGHTRLDEQGFEYTADPRALLRGYLVMGGLFAVASLSFQLVSLNESLLWVALALFGGFFFLYPWFVMKSLRFAAYNTRYRGVRFQFTGSVGEAYMAYMLGNLAASLTGSLALPWAWSLQRGYQLNNLSYGDTPAYFSGEVGDFFIIGLKAVGFYVLAIVLGLGVFAAAAALAAGLGDSAGDALTPLTVLGFALTALTLAFLYNFVWQFISAATLKYVAQRTSFGGVVQVRTTINEWRLTWIGVTNLLAQYLTLGLATPWATVRKQRYIAGNIQLHTLVSLDAFEGHATANPDALGEAAADLFDLDIGL